MSHRYQRYLESVLEVAEDYQEIQDLLARHATLQATNDHLRQHQQESAAEAERIRVELQVCGAYHTLSSAASFGRRPVVPVVTPLCVGWR